MSINDRAREIRSLTTQSAEAIAESRRQSAEAANQTAREGWQVQELLDRYVRWLMNGVPPTGYYDKSLKDRLRGYQGRHWWMSHQESDSDQYYTIWTVSVKDNGDIYTYGLTYEYLYECIARMVAKSNVSWPYND